jgi:site-specific recombinase XerD
MLAESGPAPISQGRTLAAIRSFFRFAERIRYCRNVAAGLELPRSEPVLSERVIPQEDVHRMIELEPDERNRVLLSVLYAAGLRVSEACGLCWRNLQARGDGGQILVHGKGGCTRVVLLPVGVCLDAPVFASRSGKPLERSRVTRIVRQACERAGIAAAVSTYWLRHAHASHALEPGAPIHLVQATLGHRSVATTSRHLHARPSESSAGYLAVCSPWPARLIYFFESAVASDRARKAIPTNVAIRIAGYSCPISASAVASDRATRWTGYASP